ncbi:hypothetical protein STAS_10169 [Striga asiatica]|uniref:Uncharacterized protein n=1 Tax=Striga asiatica TaxID=4170 RepID=A0A5A7PMY6_STRAF|nr:hypothetical protein STAS_10169 [Striga asiatica]
MIKKSHMGKIPWPKLNLPFTKEGKQGKAENERSLMSKPINVNEEYKQAFRTKSYNDIRDKVQCQLETSCVLHEDQPSSSSSTNLCEFLLEPHQEPLIALNLHRFVANYFEITNEASRICGSLLTSIRQARLDRTSIKNVISFVQKSPHCSNWTSDEHRAVHENLVLFASKKNPFSQTGPPNFRELHNGHTLLLHNLTSSQCKKTKKKKRKNLLKRAIVGFIVMMGFGALAFALLLVSNPCLLGLVAPPGLGMWALAHFMKKRAEPEKLLAKVDAGAKGVFVIMNDFETMSRIVKRLDHETEHRKFVADICVRKLGEKKVLKEVVKEFETHETCFMEQLEELEKQIYLCYLDINRSTRMVTKEMMVRC